LLRADGGLLRADGGLLRSAPPPSHWSRRSRAFVCSGFQSRC
jgi:hypothetical protein